MGGGVDELMSSSTSLFFLFLGVFYRIQLKNGRKPTGYDRSGVTLLKLIELRHCRPCAKRLVATMKCTLIVTKEKDE